MSRRRRQGLSPSLFPFLAVLVCTLGTLILFLALVAQNATKAAEQNARIKKVAEATLQPAEANPVTPQLTAEAVESMLDEERFRVAHLVAVRDKQTADVEQRRDQLTHLEDHLERIRQKLKRLSDEVDQAMGDTAAVVIEDDVMTQLRARIEAERESVEKLKSETDSKTPRVVIVPHKGPNGTDRRPVYLECTDKGITIWPEGSRITLGQLEDSAYSANPLDAALRIIRLHAMKQYGDTVPPYPLLVVRPDGIETYGAARKAMQDWDDQFGYELVPADIKLAFSQPDSNLKRQVELAIRDAAAQQQARHALALRAAGGGRSYGSGLSMGSGQGRRMPTLSAASLDRAGRANGFRSHRNDDGFTPLGRSPYTSSSGQNSGSAYGNPYTSSGLEGEDAGAAARRMAEEMRSAASEIRESETRGEGNGGPGIGATSMDAPGSGGGTASGGSSIGGAGSGGAGRDASGLGGEASPSGPRISQEHASPFGRQPYQPNPYTAAEPLRDPNSADLSSINAMSGPNATGANDGGSDSGGPAQIEGEFQQGEMDANANQPFDPTGETDFQGMADASGSAGNGAQNTSDAGSRSSQRSAGTSGGGANSSGGNGGTSSTPSGMMNPPSAADRSPASSNSSVSNMSPPMGANQNMQDLVRRQGRDWALPAAMAGARGNAIIRTIRVQCFEDRFVLTPSISGGPTEMFGFSHGDIDRATLQLATAIRDRIERWGPALPGGRWQPRLDVQVMPRGETRFHQLRTLMSGSGVDVTGRASP